MFVTAIVFGAIFSAIVLVLGFIYMPRTTLLVSLLYMTIPYLVKLYYFSGECGLAIAAISFVIVGILVVTIVCEGAAIADKNKKE